jgi:hypothetical protein
MADEDEFRDDDDFGEEEAMNIKTAAAVRSQKSIKGVAITEAAAFGSGIAPKVTGFTPKVAAVTAPKVAVTGFTPKVAAATAPRVAAAVAATAPDSKKVTFADAPIESVSNAAGVYTEKAAIATSKLQPTLPADPIKLKSLKPSIIPPITTAAEINTFTQMTKDEFVSPEMVATKVDTVNRDPIELKSDEVAKLTIPDPANPSKTKTETLPAYRPITAPSFNDFIIQTYMRYSPALTQLEQDLEKGITDPVIKERDLDPDACLKRDPNKVETFYYQKFVRDYLGRDTPYRGLLVYHGLGSGKTCTSIAAAEALHWGGLKKIYILTPATLSANYRRELGKCGYYPLRRHNHWAFLKSSESPSARTWLVDRLGLPPAYVDKLGGGWVANPKKASNWDTLEEAERKSIRDQQEAHITHRFTFIHYNGVSPEVLANYAARGVQVGKSMFDDGVVIIDEVHNLVRTINGTKIGNSTLARYIEEVEPREFTWSVPKYREVTGFRYPRGYSLYRLLQNAVGAKIIALSATPMINYAQELAILMNIVGGEQRVVELSLKHLRKGKDLTRELEEWAKKHPAIDFFKIEQSTTSRDTVLTVTPVPHGFVKVVDKDFATRGFVRPPVAADARDSRERNMDTWAASLVKELEEAGFLDAGRGASAESATAVAVARALGPGNLPKTTAFSLLTYPMLPEDKDTFVENFIDRARLKIVNDNILRARSLGLVSYYRGGAEDLMPRSERVDVHVPMSDYTFKEYIAIRKAEIEMEKKKKKTDVEEPTMARSGRRATETEMDLYAQATKTQQSGFHARTRAACNWVFPEDVQRPLTSLSDRDRERLLGLKEENEILATDFVADIATDAPGGSSSNVPAGIDGPETTAAVLPDEEGGAPAAVTDEPLSAKLQSIIGTLMQDLEANADEYLHTGLANYSAKYAAMIENIRTSPGPVLVYSQFKTLEGLGIFAAALRATDEQYLPLDIVRSASGEWSIPDVLMDPTLRSRPRYVLYTGDQELEKRRLLLQLYNADVAGLPTKLSAQCAELLAGAPDNRDGRICRVFMITQSGAEGISLFNTRQVHIMEPYWNNVRIEQVIGRAIRLCSHMRLPWDDRLVNVFTYMTVFSEKQLQSKDGDAKMVVMFDNYKTTEETINNIATIKQKLADGLSEIAQSAAVDCNLHFHEHGKVTKCFSFGTGRRPLFSYHPDWEKDIADAGLRSIA